MIRSIGRFSLFLVLVTAAAWIASSAAIAASPMLPEGTPLPTIDLAVTKDVRTLGGEWRYSDVRIVPKTFYAADARGSVDARIQNHLIQNSLTLSGHHVTRSERR